MKFEPTLISDLDSIIRDARAAAKPFEQERAAGVYFLFQGDELVYIGESSDIPRRLRAHSANNGRRGGNKGKRVGFDRVAWFLTDRRKELEAALITKLAPKLNASADYRSNRGPAKWWDTLRKNHRRKRSGTISYIEFADALRQGDQRQS